MTYEKMKEEIKDASLVLVGLGEELTGELSGFYKELAELLKNKDYFIERPGRLGESRTSERPNHSTSGRTG